MSKAKRTNSPAEQNIQLIARLEKRALHARSRADRISDSITAQAGSMRSVVFHVCWYTTWILINVEVIPVVRPFDPYPFSFLTLVVSLEAIFLSVFVLISQNRMSGQADKRAHLDLQVDLLAEQEMTLILKMLYRICEHHGLEIEVPDNELQVLMEKTDVHHLLEELEKKLPSETQGTAAEEKKKDPPAERDEAGKAEKNKKEPVSPAKK